MGWKKIIENKDVIVLEKSSKDKKFKIEARKTDDYSWEVFKTHVQGDYSSLLSEHILDDKNQVNALLKKLMSEKEPNKIQKLKAPAIRVSVRRAYKEDFVEKWNFFVEDKSIKNILIAKFDNNIQADIIMHEKYRYYEKTILAQLEEKLGLQELGDTIKYEVYYFRKKNQSTRADNNFDVIDVEFDFGEEN